jgi:protein Tex
MTRPEYGKTILGVDPGYRTGCKLVILDPLGNPLTFSKIFLDSKNEAEKILKTLVEKYTPDVIVVGNGTGSDETIELLQSLFSVPIFIVNESGASVYSASEVAQDEFPDLDVTDRGTVSIARRYIDPLSELVKVPVGSIGVGMYQHDIAEKKLEERLGYTVEDTVNQVGVNVNTASVHVLSYVSGLDKRTAKKIYNHRPYASRAALAKVLTSKAYEQSIGFMRIPESAELLDNTDIHPDQYALAHYVIDSEIESSDFSGQKEKLSPLYAEVSARTLEFIWESYRAIGRDPRTQSSHREAKPKKSITELAEGSIVTGVVRNVVAFGAFVDIGMKNDGLVHVSEIADRYVANPMDFLSVGQEVKARIVRIDAATGKIQLSLRGV